MLLCAREFGHNEGEKNTKYFLSLEKRHYKQGTINRLKKNENEYATSDKDILNVCEAFYKDLYSTKIRTDRADTEFFFQSNNTVLSNNESESIEGWLTEAECATALKDMEAGKSPGSDGLPSEFYKMFWSDLSEALVKSLNYGYLNGQLSVSQRRGIIKLIPKKSEELYYIRNWRPLTLLNCDYKIAAKAIASRLKIYLPKLINNDQKLASLRDVSLEKMYD